MRTLRRKMVLIGDAGVGKTALVTYMAQGIFTGYYVCGYGENVKEVAVDDNIIELTFWDTSGHKDHDILRPLSYPNTGIILICFAVDNVESFLNVSRRWYPEVLHFCSTPTVPILLVGCKTDLRKGRQDQVATDSSREAITSDQCHTAAAKIGAVKYMECSAKHGEGVRKMLEAAGRIAGSWDPYAPQIYGRSSNCLPL